MHLYDLNYKGCISCFACKTIGGKSYGRCAVQDDLTGMFSNIEQADAVILGSPIYFGAVSGEMKSFLERLLFPYSTYTDPPGSLFPGKIKTGFIYTMNVSEEMMQGMGYSHQFKLHEMTLQRIYGASEYMCSFDTYQFDDYSKVVATRFDPVKKAKRRAETFPVDCERAFQMGVRVASKEGTDTCSCRVTHKGGTNDEDRQHDHIRNAIRNDRSQSLMLDCLGW
jgi:multimeric flavodoxin WrbA